MENALVTGAGGFIGGHLVKRLLDEGFRVRAVDIKPIRSDNGPSWWQVWREAENIVADLRESRICHDVCDEIDHVYQLAANMGGAGYVFSGENDAEIFYDNLKINLSMAYCAWEERVQKIFYSSSACIYPTFNQEDRNNPNCAEASAYPAMCDHEYGWEKLASERLYLSFARNYGIKVRIARLHNVYGPRGSWNDGREKAPAAICRKVAEAVKSGNRAVNVWGDGTFTRSFMWIGDCIEGIRRIMDSPVRQPLNLGSEEMVTINQLVDIVAVIAGIQVEKVYDMSKPQGVPGRNSDNTLIKECLDWEPGTALRYGLEQTYRWVAEQVTNQ